MGNVAPDIARNIDKSQLNCDCRVLDHLSDCRECTFGLQIENLTLSRPWI